MKLPHNSPHTWILASPTCRFVPKSTRLHCHPCNLVGNDGTKVPRTHEGPACTKIAMSPLSMYLPIQVHVGSDSCLHRHLRDSTKLWYFDACPCIRDQQSMRTLGLRASELVHRPVGRDSTNMSKSSHSSVPNGETHCPAAPILLNPAYP